MNARELEEARAFREKPEELKPATKELLKRRALLPESIGISVPIRKQTLACKNPSRRAVYQLLGIYLPEREAKALLRRIHDFKWIEAEKAGCDIWRKREPRAPLKAAAKQWASNHLPKFLERGEKEAA